MNIEEAADKAQLSKMPADSHCREPYWTATDDELQRFAKIIRNQALEEALLEIEQGIWFDMTTEQILDALARAVLSMKEQT